MAEKGSPAKRTRKGPPSTRAPKRSHVDQQTIPLSQAVAEILMSEGKKMLPEGAAVFVFIWTPDQGWHFSFQMP